MKQENLEIGGFQKLGQTLPSAIGTQHGGTGVVAQLSDFQEKMAARLLAAPSKENTKSLVHALGQSYGLWKKNRGLVLQGEPEICFEYDENTDWQGAAKAIEAAFTPAPETAILAAIGILEANCTRRAEGEQEGEISLRAQLIELKKYPADFVIQALSEWHLADMSNPKDRKLRNINRFVPSMAELLNGVMDSDGYWLFRGIRNRSRKRSEIRHSFYFWKGKLGK